VTPSDRLIQPSRKEFLALAREHTLVPVCRTLTADLETPVSAFLRAAWQERECFLLESVEGGEQVGRYTFIGINPYKRIVAHGRHIDITEGKRSARIEGDVFAVLREALGGHKPARLPGLPPFTAGAVGIFAYDAVRQIERLLLDLAIQQVAHDQLFALGWNVRLLEHESQPAVAEIFRDHLEVVVPAVDGALVGGELENRLRIVARDSTL